MEKKNVLKSSHLLHFRFDVARRFAWNDIEFPGESFELALLLLPIKGMISGAWTRAAHSILFFFLSLFFKAARFNEERGEKGGEFIRGAACSSLCQQRQRELISFSLAEKAAQRRSKRKREPRGTNELREIHREIMQIFQSFFPLPSTSIVPRQGLSRVFFPPSPDKFALIRGMRIFLTRVSFFLFLIIFEEYIETWIFLYFQDMWRYI